MMTKLLEFIKRLPIDLGQGWYRHTTKAKLTAFQTAGAGHGRKALDLGCGDGYWSTQLRNQGWETVSVDGYDLRYNPTGQVNFEKPLPYPDSSFDLVWCSEVIEHIANIDMLVQEIRRITKPKGRIVITTPNSDFWLYRVLALVGIKPKDVQNPDHKQFFKIADIRRLFPKATLLGFFPYAIVKITIRSGIGALSPTFIIIEEKQ